MKCFRAFKKSYNQDKNQFGNPSELGYSVSDVTAMPSWQKVLHRQASQVPINTASKANPKRPRPSD
jgi:hypothetical protein